MNDESKAAASLKHALQRLGCALADPNDEARLDCVFVEASPATGSRDALLTAVRGRCHSMPRAAITVAIDHRQRHPASHTAALAESPYCLPALAQAIERVLARQQEVGQTSASTPATASSETAEIPSLRGLRVLVAEDNVINQKIVLAMLHKMSVEAEAFANGQLALAALHQGDWHLVLMDIQMPVMDGIAATAAIRAEEKELGCDPLPIIALSANVQPADIEAGMAAGFSAYLSKPVGLKQLHRTLAEHAIKRLDERKQFRCAFS